MRTPSVSPSVCQLPGRGAFWFTANQKLSPQAGKVAASAMSRRKGNGSEQPSYFPIPPQSACADSSPASGGAFLVCGTNSHIKPALKWDSSRARPVGDAARRESGGIGSIASGSAARRPYSNQRCGCECSEQTEGLYRGCSCLRQPLSHGLRRASSP